MGTRETLPQRAAAVLALAIAISAAVLLFTAVRAQGEAARNGSAPSAPVQSQTLPGRLTAGHRMGNGMRHGCAIDAAAKGPAHRHGLLMRGHGHRHGMINCAVTADANSANSANSAGDEQADSGKDNESLALPGDPMRGQQLTLASGCLACHSLRGGQATVGPTWYNLAETASQRVRGQSAAEYLYSSIVNPNAYVVQGYSPNVMPQTYGRLLSDSELADIAGYLLTLDGE